MDTRHPKNLVLNAAPTAKTCQAGVYFYKYHGLLKIWGKFIIFKRIDGKPKDISSSYKN